MRWTTRLKRWGGYLMIEAHRGRQFEQIAKTIEAMPEHRQTLLRGWWEWMNGNALRVMPPAVEEYFWPSVIDAEYTD